MKKFKKLYSIIFAVIMLSGMFPTLIYAQEGSKQSYDFSTDFSDSVSLESFSVDSGVTASVLNGELELSGSDLNKKMSYSLNSETTDDLVSISFKIKKSQNDNFKVFINGEQAIGFFRTGTTAVGGQFFAYLTQNQYAKFTSNAVYPYNDTLTKITMLYDLKNGFLRVFANDNELNYYSSGNTLYNDGKYINTGVKSINKIGFSVSNASGAGTVVIDDFDIASKMNIFESQISAIDANTTSDEIISLYNEVTYYKELGYVFENYETLYDFRKNIKAGYTMIDDFSEVKYTDVGNTASVDSTSFTDNTVLKLKGTGLTTNYVKYDLPEIASNDTMSLSFKVYKNSQTNFKVQIDDSADVRKDSIAIFRDGVGVGNFYAYLPNAKYAFFNQNMASYHPCDDKWADLRIEYDLKNGRLRMFENGVETEYLDSTNNEQWNDGKYASNNLKSAKSIIFAVNGSAYIDDIKITSAIDDINSRISALPSAMEVSVENAQEIADIRKQVEYYSSDAGYGDGVFFSLDKLAEVENAVNRLDKTSEIGFGTAADNIAYIGQEQRFEFTSNDCNFNKIAINGNEIPQDKYSITENAAVVSADEFLTEGEYTVKLTNSRQYAQITYQISTDDRLIYNDENLDNTAAAENTEGVGNGDGIYTPWAANNIYWIAPMESSTPNNFTDAFYRFRHGGTIGYNGSNITYLTGITSSYYEMIDRFYWKWNVVDAGTYNIDFYQPVLADMAELEVEVKDKHGVRKYILSPKTDSGFTCLSNESMASVFEFAGDGNEYIKVKIAAEEMEKNGNVEKLNLNFAVDSVRLRHTYSDAYETERLYVAQMLEEKLSEYDASKKPIEQKDLYYAISKLIINAKGMGIDIDSISNIEKYTNTEFVHIKGYKVFNTENLKNGNEYVVRAYAKNENVLKSAEYCAALCVYKDDALYKVTFLSDSINQGGHAIFDRNIMTNLSKRMPFVIPKDESIENGGARYTIKLLMLEDIQNISPHCESIIISQ